MLWFIFLGIAPGQGKKLFKLIQEPSDLKTTSCDLERAVVNLYMESRDKDIKKQLLSLISLSHTKKELQKLIPQLSVYAINEARKHALDKKEGRFYLNTINNVSNWNLKLKVRQYVIWTVNSTKAWQFCTHFSKKKIIIWKHVHVLHLYYIYIVKIDHALIRLFLNTSFYQVGTCIITYIFKISFVAKVIHF